MSLHFLVYVLLSGSILAIGQNASSQTVYRPEALTRTMSVDASISLHSNRSVLASEVINKMVIANDGVRLGEIRDVVLNVTTGEIRYLLLEFNPVFFKAEKLYAFPARALSLSGARRVGFYKHSSSQILEKIQAASTVRPHQNIFPDQSFVTDQGSRQLPPLGNGISIRTSRLLGRHISGSDGYDLGTITDLGLDLSTSKLMFVVLVSARQRGPNRNMKMLPATDLLMFEATRDLSASFDSANLKSLKSFDRQLWDSLDDDGRTAFLNAAQNSSRTKK